MKHNHKPASHTFDVGDHARLNRALPPVLSGSIVAVVQVSAERWGVRYQVQATEYEAAPVWAEEGDLSWALLTQ